MTSADADIMTARAKHPITGVHCFERARQDGRTYYRLMTNGQAGGSLTNAVTARATIAYWTMKGWLQT